MDALYNVYNWLHFKICNHSGSSKLAEGYWMLPQIAQKLK